MSKNVLILSSSPRRGGNSDTLCEQFKKGAQEAGHQVEKIFLKDKKINYCTGCGTCSELQKPCPQQDDANEIVSKMIAADVIVMASPVYFYTVCGQMKTMIDRCCARYTEISGKDFYFIVTAADPNKKMLQRTVEDFRGFLDCLDNATERGIVYGTGVWKRNEIDSTPAMDEAYGMGKNA